MKRMINSRDMKNGKKIADHTLQTKNTKVRPMQCVVCVIDIQAENVFGEPSSNSWLVTLVHLPTYVLAKGLNHFLIRHLVVKY